MEDNVKTYYINRFGLPDEYGELKNGLEVKQIILKILYASDYTNALNSFIELYYACHKSMKRLNQILDIPMRNCKIKDMPIIQKLLRDFNPNNIMKIDAVVGMADVGSSLRERAIYKADIFYISCEGKTDGEILAIYKDRREIYRQINQAILNQDKAFLKENIALILSMPCYRWSLSYFSLTNSELEPNTSILSRKKESK